MAISIHTKQGLGCLYFHKWCAADNNKLIYRQINGKWSSKSTAEDFSCITNIKPTFPHMSTVIFRDLLLLCPTTIHDDCAIWLCPKWLSSVKCITPLHVSSAESFALLKGVAREIFALSVENIHKTDDKESAEVERQEIVFHLAPLP